MSFYRDNRIVSLLKIDLVFLGKARQGLVERSLIAYESPLYQVLSLPPGPVHLPSGGEKRGYGGLGKEEFLMDQVFFSRVRHLYEVEGLSMRQIAKKLGVSRKRVSRVIRNVVSGLSLA